jgi:hypothetical protein
MQAAVPEGVACALHECSVSPTLLSAVWRVPLLMANTGTDSERGMYHTLLPRRELALMAGPGGGKLVVGLLSWATTAWAWATPALEAPELDPPVDVVELPQAAASAAVAAARASVAANRRGLIEVRCRFISG